MKTSKSKSNKVPHSGVKLQGFFRLQIVEEKNGKTLIKGDSGWRENQVTNLGIQNFLVTPLTGGAANAVTHMALGTGGAPVATDTALAGEIIDATNSRKTVSTSIVSSKTAQFTAAFASSASFITAAKNISNIALFATSTTNAGTMLAGNTFTSSSLATNQSVNATYQIRFS